MTTLKEGEKQHKREPGWARAANWFIDVTWSTVWGGLKSVTKGFDVFLIGLSYFPVAPLRQVGLDTAVLRGWLNSVKRLATPQLFQSMSYGLNSSLVKLAMKNAIDNKTDHRMEIVTTLLSRGGILSKDSLYSMSLFSNLFFLDFDSLVDHPQWLHTAIQHNAVHDNLKYELLLKTISSTIFQKHKFAEQLLDGEQNFFKSIQNDKNKHDELWMRVLGESTDTVVRTLIECTPKHLLTPQRLEPLFAQRKNVFQRKDISVETFQTLQARGFDIEGLLTTILNEHMYYPKHPSRPNTNSIPLEASLERNPALKEVVQHARNMKQKHRLISSVALGETPGPTHEDQPLLQRKRKM